MASTIRRSTRASVRASPAPSVDEEELAAAITPRAAASRRRRTEGVRQTPAGASSLTLAASTSTATATQALGTASVSRSTVLRRQTKQSGSTDVSGVGARQVASLVAATRARRTTSRLSAPAQPTMSTPASSSTPAAAPPATVQEDVNMEAEEVADMPADGQATNAAKDEDDDNDQGDALELAVARNPDALPSILGHSTRLLSHYYGTLERAMAENLPDVYYPDVLEALSVLAPSQALDAAPLQLRSARSELRVANVAMFLRGIWLDAGQLGDGAVVRPEKVRDFAESWRVFLDVFAGQCGVALDGYLLGLLQELSTQLYLLKLRTTFSRTIRAREALLKQLFPPTLVSSWAGEGPEAELWRQLCEERIKEIKSSTLEDLRIRYPYLDFRNDIVNFCSLTVPLGTERVEAAGGAGVYGPITATRSSFGGLEVQRSLRGPSQGRKSEPASRRPRYTADLPPPLRQPSPIRRSRQSMPAGLISLQTANSTSASRFYTPPLARQARGRTPIVQIPADEESSADEYAGSDAGNAEPMRVAVDEYEEEEDDDDMVEAELSEMDTEQVEESSDGASSLDEELETADEAEEAEPAAVDVETVSEEEGALDFAPAPAVGESVTSPGPTPRAYRPREGKQRAALSEDGGSSVIDQPLTTRSAAVEGDEADAGSEEDENEVALLTQVDDDKSQPIAEGIDEVPWDNLWDEDESMPVDERQPSPDHLQTPTPESLHASPARAQPAARSPPATRIAVVHAPVVDLAAAWQSEPEFTQDSMGGGHWSPEPESQRPAPVQPSPSRALAPAHQVPDSTPRRTANERPRPSRARPSQMRPSDFYDTDDDGSDRDDAADRPSPVRVPRSTNRYSPPVDFAPPPRVVRDAPPAASLPTSPVPPPPSPASGRSADAMRRAWTDEETLYMVRKAMQLRRGNSNPFAHLVKYHGTNGRKNHKLAGRSNVNMKDKMRHYLTTTYPGQDEVPDGLARYLQRSDPRYKAPKRRARAAASQRSPQKRRRVEREATPSEPSSSDSEVLSPSSGSEEEDGLSS